MNLESWLKEKEQEIGAKWQNAVIDSYPIDSGKFLLGNKDRFANPIGYSINEELPKIFKQLTGEMNIELLRISLEEIIKIRAVQNFTPSEAVGFLYFLKDIVKSELNRSSWDDNLIVGFFEFESRIDRAVMISFEIYLDMKLKISDIRTNEIKKRNQRMMSRIHEKYGMAEDLSEELNLNN